jgi:ribonucleoside-diphosphate reductase alpha chain
MLNTSILSEEYNPLVFLAQQEGKLKINWIRESGLPTFDQTLVEVIKRDGTREPFAVAKLLNSIGAAYLDSLLASKFGTSVHQISSELNPEIQKLITDEEREEVNYALSEVLKDLQSRIATGQISTQGIAETIISALNRIDTEVADAYVAKRVIKVNSKFDDGELKVVRRNNEITPFNSSKIQAAIAKAFIASGEDPSPALILGEQVGERLKLERPAYVHIEIIQDYVQAALMRAGYFRVAERYIAYRARRALLRDLGEINQTRSKDAPPAPLGSFGVITPTAASYEFIDSKGRKIIWQAKELELRIDFALTGLKLSILRDELRDELFRSVRSGMTKADVNKSVLLNAKAMMERDPEYALFSGRILLTYIYEEVLGWDILTDGVSGLKQKHEKYFVEQYVNRGIELDMLNSELKNFDLKQLAQALDPSSDLNFDLLSIQTLYDRYLIIDRMNQPEKRIETPQIMWMRIAMGLSLLEKQKEKVAIEIYNLYRRKLFCSSTPTLFNSGTPRSQLSSCFLYYVGDSLEEIMTRGIAENAYLCKYAGGLGGSWTAVRGAGALIKGTNGYGTGVIPFLKIHNDQLVAVNQGGKRKGVGCAYLELWHSDIIEFLDLRKNVGDERRRTHDMNTANWIPDLFMQRLNERSHWTLFHSSEVNDLPEIFGSKFKERYEHYEKLAEEGKIFGKKIQALDLWKKMLAAIFETGHPWFTFKDACNVRSPQDHVGVIHSSNLCTEITLNTGPDETAVCNLGSLILTSFYELDAFNNYALNRDLLRSTVRLAVRMLDNVIDINFYPTEAAKRSNLRHRPVGLGLMGLQDVLFMKKIRFNSDEAVEFNDELMELISYYAIEASSDLALERGKYETYTGSKWDRGLLPIDTIDLLERERGEEVEVSRTKRLDWDSLRNKVKTQGMRNSNVMAIAPTATISNLMGTVPCIEPVYKHLYVESNLSGNFVMLNKYLVSALKEQGLWDSQMVDDLKYYDGQITQIARIPADIQSLFATAFDVTPEYVVKAAAARQKWIDQSQSVNIFASTTDIKTLSHIYKLAWKTGLKTTYYLRTLAASGIDKATISKTPKQKADEAVLACSLEAAMRGEVCESCQ